MEQTMNQTVRQPLSPIAASDFRKTLGCFATGVAVITTTTETGQPIGLTVNSFSSVSLEPPLVLWSLACKAWSLPVFQAARGFAVNILASDQEAVCRAFSRNVEDRFAGVDWTRGIDGLPLIEGAVATLQCQHWARYDGGDHEIFVGEVLDCSNADRDPLIFHRGRLGLPAAA
jgi:flavin reductase (DIM6/NTAB) family NADH-FMN oxidoreductase RutF